ncbi:transcription termination factor NusA [Helcococcus ovis]|uniref:Transcription termination/antitermination protein NusA n=1 Tax=Helcococcus ovis TaxID=72026 RepID=A0A4R9C168_9FIRM|nr:transcription termination factor NusA [Helcococcus ovis]TFF65451.1 transcription termination/antitermination protein NusA [Helcococcus ovis]TFF66087.1 transcription termination/antitermination protein NusA [Helcococcus ovis]TFF67851.1 transcription termination/antitermination protein NusA [Helcococcus ovis]WNZ02030.1 transcription termination factor NusA [Helcococcus ovis]
MNKEFIRALDEIEKEKGIKKEEIITAVERALEKSFEENYDSTNVEISINEETGDTKVLAIKEVVENVIDPNTQISLEEALFHNKRAKIGKELKIKVTPKNFARVAAQKARNIVIQYIRDAERKVIYESYIDKEKDIINGIIQRIDYKNIYVDLGKSEGYIPEKEQVEGENFKPGDRVKLYVKEVKETSKGPQILLSRRAPEFVAKLFEIEVPEISQGTVEIMSISREAGYRTKIAVYAEDSSIDPVGACVGMKGARVNSIVEEINGEKIDIVVWSKDMKVYISNSLSPSEVVDVYIDADKKEAVAFVPDSQLSLAIGKEGQNVRLAAKLTNWKIDIKAESKMDEVLKELEELKLRESEVHEDFEETTKEVINEDSQNYTLDDINE